MPGSKPIKTITIPKLALVNISKGLSEHLTKLGWKWYVDFFITETEHEYVVQLFKEELIPEVKQYIVENMI